MAKRWYNSKQWTHLRNWFIKQNPLCVKCLAKGKAVASHQIDHIKPIKEGGSQTDVTNLQALCDTCHSRKTRQENPSKQRIISTTFEFADEITVIKYGSTSSQVTQVR